MLDSTDLNAFCEQTLDEVYRYALRLTGGDTIRKRRRRDRNQIRGWQPAVVEANDGQDDVIAALGSLRPDERVVLVLRHVDGFSIAEIADTVGKSVAATDSMLRRGRDRLRSHILRERQEAV